MIRQLACATILAFAALTPAPLAAQDFPPTWSSQDKIDWAVEYGSQFCPVPLKRRVTIQDLPGWMQERLPTATVDEVAHCVQMYCPQIQAAVAAAQHRY